MPKPIKTIAAALAVAGLTAATPALADHHGHHADASRTNIVEAAMATGVHDTLVAALEAADLVGTLSGDGPFTVFAPTDTAFAKLPDGTVNSLVQPANRDTLAAILTYHVVAGTVTASDLAAAIRQHGGSYSFTTLNGAELTARLGGGTIIVTDAAGRATAVTQADLTQSNGVIHVTDGVFLPG